MFSFLAWCSATAVTFGRVKSLGVEAIKAGKSVYFSTLAERIRLLSWASLLIVDKIGYLPLGLGGGNLFFQLVNACYEKNAMILTSNRGFGEWAEVFSDAVVATALLDRLLHHAVVLPIEGNSYRLREHADLIPEHLRRSFNRDVNPSNEDKKRGPGRPKKERQDQHTG